jgi:hypothetical protein
MQEIARMRLGVLHELKNLKRFLENMERSVKGRDEDAVQKAYLFLKAMVYHMNEGDLTPKSIALHKEILLAIRREDEEG